MTETTALDAAHAEMQAAPDDAARRLRFYERLADTELHLLLNAEPEHRAEDEAANGAAENADEGGADDRRIDPRVFPVEQDDYVLVFDREHRLSRFVGAPAPYAALSGRALVAMLARAGLGMGVNLEVAPSSILIPPDAVAWLAQTLSHAPAVAEARPVEVERPRDLPRSLLQGLDTKLGMAEGMARAAYLAAVRYSDGGRGHLLAFVDAAPGAEQALAQAAGEALIFSGVEEGVMDVAFFDAADPICALLARAGLRFDLPQRAVGLAQPVAAPGSDPDRPPILR